MNIMRQFTSGVMSVLKVTGTPLLYRYPYRNSAEAFQSDWAKINHDIANIMGRMEEAGDGQPRRDPASD